MCDLRNRDTRGAISRQTAMQQGGGRNAQAIQVGGRVRLARRSGPGASARSVVLSRSADPSRRRVRGRGCDRHVGAPDFERPEGGARPDRRRGKSAGSERLSGLESCGELRARWLHAAARRERAWNQPGLAQKGHLELRSADAIRRGRGGRDLAVGAGPLLSLRPTCPRTRWRSWWRSRAPCRRK